MITSYIRDDGHGAAVREARRHLRPTAPLAGRDLDLRRLGAVRPRADDETSLSRSASCRGWAPGAVRARARDDRRHRPAAIPRGATRAVRVDLRPRVDRRPPLGGIFVDQASWRWAFYINIPVGLIAMTVIAIAIPKRPLAMTTTSTSVARRCCRRGHELAPSRAGLEPRPRLGVDAGARPVRLAIVLLTAFAFVERRAPEPILPFDLPEPDGHDGRRTGPRRDGVRGDDRLRPALRPGRDRDLGDRVRCRADAVHGRRGPDQHAWGRVSRTGCATVACARRAGRARCRATCSSRTVTTTSDAEAATYMAVTGVGLRPDDAGLRRGGAERRPVPAIGSATALTQFSRSIGATLGVTLMGVIINHGLPSGAAVEEASVRRLPPTCAMRSQRRCSRPSLRPRESRWSSS